jgi:two-component system chemotaxis response regulator CheY
MEGVQVADSKVHAEEVKMSISVLLAGSCLQSMDTLKRGLIVSGYKNIQSAKSQEDLAALIQSGAKFDVAVIHISDEVTKDLQLLSAVRKLAPQAESIVVSASNDADLAKECIKMGAFDYLTMPFTKDDLVSTLKRSVQYKIHANGRPRILIMEDDPVSGRLMQKYLDPYGDCTLVVDGRAAIDIFEQAVLSGDIYHLLILDIMVPEIHGKDVLKRIREIESQHGIPAARRSRAIMTTALSDTGNVVESFKSLCDAYLVKPIDRKVLIDELAGLGFNTEIAAPK